MQFRSPCRGPFLTSQRTLAIPQEPPSATLFALGPESFQHGAVYFALGDENRWAVCSPDGAEQIIFTGNQPWLALWGVPGADLLCVEPLSGTTDDPRFDGQIAHKRGIQWLHAGAEQRHHLSLSFPADSKE